MAGTTSISSRWIWILPATSILRPLGSQRRAPLLSSPPSNPALPTFHPSSSHFAQSRTSLPVFIGR